MSTSEQSSPEPDGVSPRRRGPARPLIAVAIVALAVIVAAVAILPRITASGSFMTCCGPPRAASQALSLSMQALSTPDLSSLDPVYAGITYQSTAGQVARLLFDGLVTLDDANNVELWGADRVNVSPDGLTYTFHVRAGQSFSDGTPVRPSDYAWSIDRVFNPCVEAAIGSGPSEESGLTLIKDSSVFANESCASDSRTVKGGIQTLVGDSILPDDSTSTLMIVLAHPAAYFLGALAGIQTSVVERGAMNGLGTDGAWLANLASGTTGMGGSGMFYVASWDHTDSVVLKPNPHWWGNSAGKKPNFTEIDIHLYGDATLDYAGFEASSYDYVDAAPRDSLIAAQSRPDYHLVPELLVSSVAFDWESAPFTNTDARQALCLALNRDVLVQDALNAAATNSGAVPRLPSWRLVPQGMPGYDSHVTGIDGVTATSGDLVKAQAHWQAYLATLKGKPVPPVEYLYSSASPTQTIVANDIVSQWSNAFPGLKVSKDIPRGLLQVGQYPFQSTRFAWLADYPDPQDFLSQLYSTGATYNIGHVSVPGADALMAEADRMSDPADQAARVSLYQQAEQQLVQQVATCPLFQYQSAYLLRSDIYGMRQNGLGLFPNDDWVQGYRV